MNILKPLTFTVKTFQLSLSIMSQLNLNSLVQQILFEKKNSSKCFKSLIITDSQCWYVVDDDILSAKEMAFGHYD